MAALKTGHSKDLQLLSTLTFVLHELEEGVQKHVVVNVDVDGEQQATVSTKKRGRGLGLPPKRSERVLLLTAEREEADRQQRLREVEAQQQRIQQRQDMIHQMAQGYITQFSHREEALNNTQLNQ